MTVAKDRKTANTRANQPPTDYRYQLRSDQITYRLHSVKIIEISLVVYLVMKKLTWYTLF